MQEPLNTDVLIKNRKGLHARASAKFVRCAEAFEADVQVTKDSQTVGATSIMGLMMLGASQGSTIHLAAEGPQAQEAMAALVALVDDLFGEGE